jgi:hypothetical protein
MSFWNKLGKIALTAAPYVAAPFTGGASLLATGAANKAVQKWSEHDAKNNLAKGLAPSKFDSALGKVGGISSLASMFIPGGQLGMIGKAGDAASKGSGITNFLSGLAGKAGGGLAGTAGNVAGTVGMNALNNIGGDGQSQPQNPPVQSNPQMTTGLGPSSQMSFNPGQKKLNVSSSTLSIISTMKIELCVIVKSELGVDLSYCGKMCSMFTIVRSLTTGAYQSLKELVQTMIKDFTISQSTSTGRILNLLLLLCLLLFLLLLVIPTMLIIRSM